MPPIKSPTSGLVAGLICLLAAALPSPAQPQAAPEKQPESAPAEPSPESQAVAPALVDSAPAPEPEAVAEGSEESRAPGQLPESQNEQGRVHMEDLSVGEEIGEPTTDRPFLADTTVKLQLRNFYFHRERYDESHAEAWAQGGSLSLKSGYFLDRFSVGAVVYTSQPLQAEDGRQGSGLLDTEPGGYNLRFSYSRDAGLQRYTEQRIHQDGYTVLGQIYGELKIIDSLHMYVGRREYNTPYVNMHDVRMTPKTFEGITMLGTHPGKSEGSEWRYGFGYLTKMKNWTDSTFEWMSGDLGVEKDRGVVLGGLNYSNDRFSLGAINYYSDDIINIFYTEGSYAWTLSPKASLKLSAQFSDQRSTGDELITGEDFDVQHYGAKADLQYGPAILTLAYTDVSGGDVDMRSPWGGYPGYTSVQVTDFNRAGESAFMVKAGYDFTHLGLKDLSAYALWVHGSDRDDPSPEVEVYDEDEWNVNLQWAPSEGKLEDFSARIRYAEIEQDGGGDPKIKDFRVIINYNFAIR